jgi:hypothetical protein
VSRCCPRIEEDRGIKRLSRKAELDADEVFVISVNRVRSMRMNRLNSCEAVEPLSE